MKTYHRSLTSRLCFSLQLLILRWRMYRGRPLPSWAMGLLRSLDRPAAR
jgi:hypothetical protein